MEEKKRLEELYQYHILDTPAEDTFNDLVQLASLLYDVPIALLSLVDEDRQWFKAKVGVALDQTPREGGFCDFAITQPDQIVEICDANNDERFVNHHMVTGPPYIRFYAGATLTSSNGYKLGTLCIIDSKPRKLTQKQRKALLILAKKVMYHLNTRKLMVDQNRQISYDAHKLSKLTQNIPSTIFQLRKSIQGQFSYDFISMGDFVLPDTLSKEALEITPQHGFDLIYPEDRAFFMNSLEESYQTLSMWQCEYRVQENNSVNWYMVKAKPDKLPNGDVVWYGIYQNISSHIAYEEAMEKMAFDISHVLRKPIANLTGLSAMIEQERSLSEEELSKYSDLIKIISEELDRFTNELNNTYTNKLEIITDNITKRREKITKVKNK